LKIGIVGCGWVSLERHIPSWLQCGVQIESVCDLDEGFAREAMRLSKARNFHTNLQSMLKEDLDIVDICTPPTTHRDIAVEALEAGHHVLVEKPMALTLQHADEMIVAAKRNNNRLCVCHTSIFNPAVRRAKRLVEDGFIGKLRGVDIKILQRTNELLTQRDHWCHKLPGGVFSECAPHAIYLALAFLAGVNSVHAVAKKLSDFPWVGADELKVLLDAQNAVGTLTVSCVSQKPAIAMDIFGTQRSIHVDSFTQTLLKHESRSFSPVSLALDNLSTSLQVLSSTLLTSMAFSLGRLKWSHYYLFREFIESIEKRTDPPVTGEKGRETVEILETITKQIEAN